MDADQSTATLDSRRLGNIPDIYADKGDVVRLGLCQVLTEAWDVEGNTARLMAALEAAADAGAELAITPECVFHAYGSGKDQADTIRRCSAIAESVDGERIGRVKELARSRRLHVVIGFCERGEGAQIHNSAAVISSAGEILQVYRKVHCRNFEDIRFSGAFTPGDAFAVDDLICGASSVRLGTMICFDREIPESVRSLRALGAQLIACPLATDTERLDEHVNYAHNELITRARAAENEVFIAVVNHAGRQNGGTFVVGPGGEALVQLGAEAEVKVVEIPVSALVERLHAKPYGWMGWGYRRPEIYGCYLKEGGEGGE